MTFNSQEREGSQNAQEGRPRLPGTACPAIDRSSDSALAAYGDVNLWMMDLAIDQQIDVLLMHEGLG